MRGISKEIKNWFIIKWFTYHHPTESHIEKYKILFHSHFLVEAVKRGDITERFITTHYKKLDIRTLLFISSHIKLSEKFIINHYEEGLKHYLPILIEYQTLPRCILYKIKYNKRNFRSVCNHQRVPEQLIVDNLNIVCWDTVSRRQYLSENFMRQYMKYLNWSAILSKTVVSSELRTELLMKGYIQ